MAASCCGTSGTPQGGVVSPVLVNLFLHYAFDMWMKRAYPHIPFERYADDAICHCKSAKEAQALWSALADRFAACKLVLHPEKTKIVYCKDVNRRGNYPHQTFDFLGYAFRPRKVIWHGRIYTHAFRPAVSPKALKTISRTIRRWARHHHSDKAMTDLANLSGLDQLLRPILSIAVEADSAVHRLLPSPLGAPKVQAPARTTQRRERLVGPGSPCQSNPLCSLAALGCRRPNIGSRVNREVHARF